MKNDFDQRIQEIASRSSLDRMNEFVRDVQLPGPLAIAVATNRPEMLALAPREGLDAEQIGYLYDLIGVLMETNQALREHAEQVAQLTSQWMGHFKGMQSSALKLQRFANFDHTGAQEQDDDDV